MTRAPHWISLMRSLGWGFLAVQAIYIQARNVFPAAGQVLFSVGLIAPLPVTLISALAATREVVVLLGGLVGMTLAVLAAMGLVAVSPPAAPMVGWVLGWMGVGMLFLPLLTRLAKAPASTPAGKVLAVILAVAGLAVGGIQYQAGFGERQPLFTSPGQAELYAFACRYLATAVAGASAGGYLAVWLVGQREEKPETEA